jgi:hypothetical protein
VKTLAGPLATVAALAMVAGLAGVPSAAASGHEGVGLTVLIFHPDDGVDPLGVPYQGSDPFSVRYGPLVADKGRFDFPFFVADGVLPIEAIPDPGQPFASARSAYDQSVEQRLQVNPPVAMTLASLVAGRQAVTSVVVEPVEPLEGEDLHLWIAVVEDHVDYQPPPGLTNGVTDHRFTVRAVRDLGAVDLSGPANLTTTFPLDDAWQRSELSVAAWLQQGAPSPRFDAREVVQATHAALGAQQTQVVKGVLAEMLSATWCDPCLYGDEALEDVAIDRGVAQPGEATPSSRYVELSARDALPIGLAALGGLALAAFARRLP